MQHEIDRTTLALNDQMDTIRRMEREKMEQNMSQNVMITGTGRSYALGYNLVLRYLEAGDNVVATVRRESEALLRLKGEYGERLHIVNMDISSTESVERAAFEVEAAIGHLDLLINNAVLSALGMEEDFLHADMDSILETFNVSALGTMRVMKAFYPLLKKGEGMSLIINISSEAGSITKCFRSNYLDYAMAKAAVNMGTMTFYNDTKDDPGINIFCVHPGWIRTDGREENPVPLSPYDAAETLRLLFEKRRYDKEGHRFITYENEDYPF